MIEQVKKNLLSYLTYFRVELWRISPRNIWIPTLWYKSLENSRSRHQSWETVEYQQSVGCDQSMVGINSNFWLPAYDCFSTFQDVGRSLREKNIALNINLWILYFAQWEIVFCVNNNIFISGMEYMAPYSLYERWKLCTVI